MASKTTTWWARPAHSTAGWTSTTTATSPSSSRTWWCSSRCRWVTGRSTNTRTQTTARSTLETEWRMLGGIIIWINYPNTAQLARSDTTNSIRITWTPRARTTGLELAKEALTQAPRHRWWEIKAIWTWCLTTTPTLWANSNKWITLGSTTTSCPKTANTETEGKRV